MFDATAKPTTVAPAARRTMIVVRLTAHGCSHTRFPQRPESASADPGLADFPEARKLCFRWCHTSPRRWLWVRRRCAAGTLARALDLHEHQGKELFRRYGIPVSEGRLATSPAEARAAAEEIGFPVVVKAQVLIGGRGKAGGIKLAADAGEVEVRAGEILGMDIRGHTVTKVWIEHASDIAREYYLSLTFDRSAKKPLLMFTTQGGMDIEEVAATSPDALVRLHVDPLEGCHPWHARRLVYAGGVADADEQKQIAAIVLKLYEAFVGTEAMLCEINPLIVTPDGEVRALDSKFTVDDNALFRHPDLAELRDVAGADPLEVLAREKGVTYVKLDGEVGVLGNGAGPDDVDRRRRHVRRRSARELLRPRRRRRRAGRRRRARGRSRATRRSAPSSSTSSAGSRAATRSRAASCRPSSGCRSPCRSSCGSTARTRRRAGRSCATAALPNLQTEATMLDGARQSRGARGLMAILVDTETRLVVQGLTGSEGRFHGLRNRSHGTNVVAGVTPGKGGQDVEGIPVFDTVADAVAETGANTAMVFVPAPFAADAMYEAIAAGIATVVCISEGVPAHDMLRLHAFIESRDVRVVGPNCPGVLSPGKANVGIIPAEIFREGSVGLVSRSGTLTYQIGHELTQLGLGCSTIVGIGGDPIVGSSFHRRARAVRGRRADGAGGHGRRDRRRRGGEGGRVHRGGDVEAGRGLHRRVHRSAGKDDGARRRDHLGVGRDGAGQEGGARGSRRARRDDADGGRTARRRDRRRLIASPRAGRPCRAARRSRRRIGAIASTSRDGSPDTLTAGISGIPWGCLGHV